MSEDDNISSSCETKATSGSSISPSIEGDQSSSSAASETSNAQADQLNSLPVPRRSSLFLVGLSEEFSVSLTKVNEVDFAHGCILLLAAARGDLERVQSLLTVNPSHVNFRDYDRRTALHVAASEGHLDLVRFLVENNSYINRSDRWGGSPLDDALRNDHKDVARFLREIGATTGSADRTSNLLTAVASGDIEDVALLLQHGNVDVNWKDYDGRTPLHLACCEDHAKVVQALLQRGAKVNAIDRWGCTPLDDALRQAQLRTRNGQEEASNIVQLLYDHGAIASPGGLNSSNHGVSSYSSGDKFDKWYDEGDSNLHIEFSELEMIERIGAGAFGEIYKCKWKDTLVAAKCIKSAKISHEWHKRRNYEDDQSLSQTQMDDLLQDFRLEMSILSKLRHPNICMLLGYSTTENYEVMVSELMKCSLLDLFRTNSVYHSHLSRRTQISFSTQLAKGMNYLHTCRSPVIHRDLKPGNILVDRVGTVKITDFGLAKIRPKPMYNHHNRNPEDEDDEFLMTGETGCYRYMAPEVYRHENYTETVDTYSYAMVIFYIFSGGPPWPEKNGYDAVRAAAMEGSRPTLPRHFDGRLTYLLQRCWSEDPQARPSFHEIIEHLNVYAEHVFGVDVDGLAANSHDGKSCRCVIS